MQSDARKSAARRGVGGGRAGAVPGRRRPRGGGRHGLRERPSLADIAIGFVTDFLDTLGIGSYAPTTALFKFRGKPADEFIPGTLNVGHNADAFAAAVEEPSAMKLSMTSRPARLPTVQSRTT